MLYKQGHVPDRAFTAIGLSPKHERADECVITDPGGHPHHLPLACLGDPKAPRTDSTSGPMKGVPPGPAILRATPGYTLWGALPKIQ